MFDDFDDLDNALDEAYEEEERIAHEEALQEEAARQAEAAKQAADEARDKRQEARRLRSILLHGNLKDRWEACRKVVEMGEHASPCMEALADLTENHPDKDLQRVAKRAFQRLCREGVPRTDIWQSEDDAHVAGQAELAPLSQAIEVWHPAVWIVIGGADKGGLLVRSGEALDSPKLDGRVSYQAKVHEVEKKGDRLHYALVEGTGPREGWIGTILEGTGPDGTIVRKPLAEMVSEGWHGPPASPASPPDGAAPMLISQKPEVPQARPAADKPVADGTAEKPVVRSDLIEQRAALASKEASVRKDLEEQRKEHSSLLARRDKASKSQEKGARAEAVNRRAARDALQKLATCDPDPELCEAVVAMFAALDAAEVRQVAQDESEAALRQSEAAQLQAELDASQAKEEALNGSLKQIIKEIGEVEDLVRQACSSEVAITSVTEAAPAVEAEALLAVPMVAEADQSPTMENEVVAAAQEIEVPNDIPQTPIDIQITPNSAVGFFVHNVPGFKLPSVEEMIEMQEEFIAAYENSDFQSELSSTPPGPDGRAARDELTNGARIPVMRKHNLPPDVHGLTLLGELYHALRKNKTVQANNRKMMILLDPALQQKVKAFETSEEKADRELRNAKSPLERRKEREAKALANKDTVKKTAAASQTVLGDPIKYTVTRPFSLYQEPIPMNMYQSSIAVKKEQILVGYPGSSMWIKVEPDQKMTDDFGIFEGQEYWFPVKGWEDDDLEPFVKAVWQELEVQALIDKGICLQWPGLQNLPEGYDTKYTVEWLCKPDPPHRPLSCKGQGLSPINKIVLSRMPAKATVQFRVQVTVDSIYKEGGQVTLVGTWKEFTSGGPKVEEDNQGQVEVIDKEWKVIQPVVYVMACPDPEQTMNDALAKLPKGTMVMGREVDIDGYLWLRLLHDRKEAWCLIDGRAIGVKKNFFELAIKKEWEVMEPVSYIMPKADPKQTAKDSLAKRKKGDVILGHDLEIDGYMWLLTTHQDADAWVLIDGKAVGARRNFLKPFTADGNEGEGLYDVLRSVQLYSEPRTGVEALELAILKRGQRVYGAPFPIQREKWLKITPQTLSAMDKEVTTEDSIWAPIEDGNLQRVAEGGPPNRAVAEKGSSRWKVVHAAVAIRAGPSVISECLGVKGMNDRVRGDMEQIGSTRWLRIQSPEDPEEDAYICIDGSLFGIPNDLLSKVSAKGETSAEDIAKWKAAVARPMPPRPINVVWMAAYGGLPEPPYSVREELLPEKDDVGMNSQCTLLYITPAGGGSELQYVTKRATVSDSLATKDTAEQEYRFYAEFIFPPAGESQPPEGEAVMLGGPSGIRVPRCLVVNYRMKSEDVEESEEEEDLGDDLDGAELPEKKKAKAARSQYFLLLERLDAPAWNSPNPAAGLAKSESLAGAVALAKMHNVFGQPDMLARISWLPLTVFNIGRAASDNQEDFSQQVEFERTFLRNNLSDHAYTAVDKMSFGGLKDVCQQLAKPPLTFCHGDYRPENLRFGSTGDVPEVSTFDFGLSCRANCAYDLAYYIVMSHPPHARRQWEWDIIYFYLKERLQREPIGPDYESFFDDIKYASLAVLALTVITRLAARRGGFYAETRETQTRMLRWVSTAVQDWEAHKVLLMEGERDPQELELTSD